MLYSTEHTKDYGLPELLTSKALSFMPSQEMKGKPLEHTAPLFLKEYQMTTDQVKRVEIETRGQSSNDLWHQQRIGRVTASNFHTFHTKAQSILHRKGQNDKKNTVYSSLVSSLLSKNDDVSHLPQIKWGIAHKKDAIKAFMSDVASQHDGGLQGFKQCGLFIKPDYPYLAASPDGLFLCKCCSLHDRLFMRQAGRTRYFARHEREARDEGKRKIKRLFAVHCSCCSAHLRPQILTTRGDVKRTNQNTIYYRAKIVTFLAQSVCIAVEMRSYDCFHGFANSYQSLRACII